MMYRDSYVVAVLVDGKVQKEGVDGSVVLPFGSEYVLRLKNKQRKKAVADVFIDGEIACKGIIIEGTGSVDLERFVDGNMTSGNRFKIVKATDGRVSQPGESENGIIKVLFYPEKEKVEPVPIYRPILMPVVHTRCFDAFCHICHPHNTHWTLGAGSTYTSTFGGEVMAKGMSAGGAQSNNVMRSMSASAPSDVVMDAGVQFDLASDAAEAAATIKGSVSTQRFVRGYVDIDTSNPVTLELKLKGVNRVVTECSCGFVRKHNEKYCPECGKSLTD